MAVRTEASSRVVFHADDFGMNAGVNRGILTAFRDGLLTSTSVLANAPAADAACEAWPDLIAEHSSTQLPSSDRRKALTDSSLPFDLGIHLNLTQGRPLTGERFPARLLNKQGDFPGIGFLFSRLIRSNPAQLAPVADELRAQIEWMCDRGLRPSHLNGHQYVELIPPIAAMISEMLGRYSIPVVRVAYESGLSRSVLWNRRIAAWGLGLVKRHYASVFRRRIHHAGIAFPDRFFGTSHAGLINQQVLQTFLRRPLGAGCTEIGLHPGVALENHAVASDDPWFDPLSNLRPAECEWLCSSDLAEFLMTRGLALGRLKSLD